MAEMYLYDTKVGQTCKKLPQFSEFSGSKWKCSKNVLSRMCRRISSLRLNTTQTLTESWEDIHFYLNSVAMRMSEYLLPFLLKISSKMYLFSTLNWSKCTYFCLFWCTYNKNNSRNTTAFLFSARWLLIVYLERPWILHECRVDCFGRHRL